jgi:hypothetical protein
MEIIEAMIGLLDPILSDSIRWYGSDIKHELRYRQYAIILTDMLY